MNYRLFQSPVDNSANPPPTGMTGYEGLVANGLTSVNLYSNPLDQYVQHVESEVEISDTDDVSLVAGAF